MAQFVHPRLLLREQPVAQDDRLGSGDASVERAASPQVRDVRPHHAELTIRNRRAVHNHIGTLHAIAVCNGLEAAMGLLAEATTPMYQSALLALGFLLFVVTFIVLSIAKLMLMQLKKREGK